MPTVLHDPNSPVYDTPDRKPHVIIIGAGIAGLTLAILLQKAGIPYDVFEKSPEARNVGGQGATTSFHDAVELANWINALPTTQVKDLEKAFKSYRDERHAAALGAKAHAKNMRNFYGQADRVASLTRFIFKNMPFWLWALMVRKHIGCRPQASFLPPVPNTGTVLPVDLPSYCETLKVANAREAAEAEKAAQNEDVQARAGADAVPL